MRTLLAVAVLTLGVGLAQVVPASDDKSVIADKDKVNFLIIERDFTEVSARYESQFRDNPIVKEYTQLLQKMMAQCTEAKKVFNAKTVTCDEPPAPPIPPSKK